MTISPDTPAPLLKSSVTWGAGTLNTIVDSVAPPLVRVTTNWPAPIADTVHPYWAAEGPDDDASIVTPLQPVAVTLMPWSRFVPVNVSTSGLPNIGVPATADEIVGLPPAPWFGPAFEPPPPQPASTAAVAMEDSEAHRPMKEVFVMTGEADPE